MQLARVLSNAVRHCCIMHARAQLIQVAFFNFGGAAINVYVLNRRHLVVFARLPPPSEVWVACFSTTMDFAFWVGFLTNTTIAFPNNAELHLICFVEGLPLAHLWVARLDK